MNIEKGLLKGEKRACARLITMLENKDEEALDIIKRLYKHTGNAYIIGITGPPGSGKSTLTDKIVKKLREKDKKVGIIAIDPTSPFTGGAILGDRIRMNDLALDKDVFIRSMGTRGTLGGMSQATSGAVKALDVYGVDYIIIETVGVGQSEVDIVKTADTVLMVMVPNLGDDIQAIKAGTMEIAHVFAINKADLHGADKTQLEIEMNLDLNEKKDYRPAIEQVSAMNNENIDGLVQRLLEHREYLEKTDQFKEKRKRNTKLEVLKLVEEDLMELVMNKALEQDLLEELSEEILSKDLDPYTARDKIIDLIRQ